MTDKEQTIRRLEAETDALNRRMAELIALVGESEQYRRIVENADDMILRVDGRGKIAFANRVAAGALGQSLDGLLGRDALEFIHPDDKQSTREAFAAWKADGLQSVVHESRAINPDSGESFDLMWTVTLEYDSAGNLNSTTIIARDMTVRRLAERELMRSSLLIESLINSISDIIYYKDADGDYLGGNQAFFDLTGLDAADVLGRSETDIFDEQLAHRLGRTDRTVMERGKTVRDEDWAAYPDGSKVLLDLVKTPFHGPDGRLLGLIGVGRDITDRHQAEEERERLIDELRKTQEHLTLLSIMDALTGLANRRRFNDVLKTEWRRASRWGYDLGLVMIDIDYFKYYNDNFGHPAGDTCLRRVAAALKKELRRPGDFLARYGGEEFAAILPQTDLDGAVVVSERMRRSVEKLGLEHPHSTAAKVVTVSLGAASSRPHRETPEINLLSSADTALYLAKNQGRNRVAQA